MTEGRMPEIVGQADGLDQVRVDEEILLERAVRAGFEPVANRFADLRHLK